MSAMLGSVYTFKFTVTFYSETCLLSLIIRLIWPNSCKCSGLEELDQTHAHRCCLLLLQVFSVTALCMRTPSPPPHHTAGQVSCHLEGLKSDRRWSIFSKMSPVCFPFKINVSPVVQRLKLLTLTLTPTQCEGPSRSLVASNV